MRPAHRQPGRPAQLRRIGDLPARDLRQEVGARRRLLAAAAALAAWPAWAHAPYRQWKVLRERYLLVHSTRSDAAGDELAEALVAVLQRVLPQANALVSRTRDEKSLGGLLTTGQAVLGVLRAADAEALYRDDGRMLRRLLAVGERDLVTVESFPRHHGWLVSAALLENKGALPITVPSPGTIPIHSGTASYAKGEPLE